MRFLDDKGDKFAIGRNGERKLVNSIKRGYSVLTDGQILKVSRIKYFRWSWMIEMCFWVSIWNDTEPRNFQLCLTHSRVQSLILWIQTSQDRLIFSSSSIIMIYPRVFTSEWNMHGLGLLCPLKSAIWTTSTKWWGCLKGQLRKGKWSIVISTPCYASEEWILI